MIHTTAGTTLNVLATLPTTYDGTGYAALLWASGNEVGEITDFGNITLRKYNVQTHLPVSTRRAKKIKGSYDPGSMTLTLGRDIDNAGQALLVDALDSDANHSFRIVYPDGSKQYFVGKVVDVSTAVGGTDSITGRTVEVAIDSDVLEIDPA